MENEEGIADPDKKEKRQQNIGCIFSEKAESQKNACYRMLPYHSHLAVRVRSFGYMLEPLHCRRGIT